MTSPYDGSVVGTVPVAGADDVEAALSAAEHGAQTWRHTPAHERMRILRAAELADERAAEIARSISAETGKTITEATTEASRSGELIRLAAFEGTQLYGDTLPLDANRGTGQDKIGFTLRQPLSANGYSGWYVLEQDTILTEEPRGEGPVADVWASADYLRSVLRGVRR